MDELNISICVNKLVFPSVYSVLEYHAYTNADNEQISSLLPSSPILDGRSSRSAMAKVLDSGFEINEFELQSLYYVHLRTDIIWKGMNPLFP